MIPLWIPAVAPILAAALAYYLPRNAMRRFMLAFQLVQVLLVTRLLSAVRGGGTLREVIARWPAGVGIALEADIVAALLVSLVAWIYLMLLIFATRKLYADRLFQFLLGTLQGVLVGIFLSGDLFNIYVLLELATLVTGILIMYKRNKQAIYNGMIYIMVNLSSMSFMLMGIGMLYRVVGSLDLLQIAEAARTVDGRALVVPYAFLITAVGMKSALFFLFGWLPPAHGAPSAPSIVSATLSGLQINTGIYLFIRMQALFGHALATDELFLVVGALTSVAGFLLALAQSDIKLTLAYSTISQVGLIIVGLTLADETAWWGAVYHIVSHALFKVLLFLSAGVIVHVYRTREIASIRGVFRRMPLVAIAMTAGLLGITGAPFFNGSVSKYLIGTGWPTRFGEIVMHVLNVGTALYAVKLATVLFGPVSEGAVRGVVDGVDAPRQPEVFTTSVLLILGAAVCVGGFAARPIITNLLGVVPSVDGAFTAAKAVTYAATMAGACAAYAVIARFGALPERVHRFHFSFNDMITGVLLFFGLTTGYLYYAL